MMRGGASGAQLVYSSGQVTGISGPSGTIYISRTLAQVATGWILPACAALSTVSQTGTTVTFTNAVATAHNIPASTYDGYQVYFPGSASIPAGWYSGFTRTSTTQYTFTRATATVASESVNGGLAYTTDTTVATVSIPANSIGANGALRVHTTWGMNNNANTKNVNVKFDGSAIMGFGFASITAFSDLRYLRNRGVTNKQVGHPSGQGSLSSGTMTPVYLAVDTTAAKNITFTMSPATASDYVVLEGYTVEIMPS